MPSATRNWPTRPLICRFILETKQDGPHTLACVQVNETEHPERCDWMVLPPDEQKPPSAQILD
jgi:hypothetical protein